MNKNYQNLANAIVVQATKDYKKYYARLRSNPADNYAKHGIRELEEFFKSKWLGKLANIDGPEVLARIKGEIEDERKLD